MKRVSSSPLEGGPPPKRPCQERENTHLSELPKELMTEIISFLPPSGLEAMSLANKYLRQLTIDSSNPMLKGNFCLFKTMISPRQVANFHFTRATENQVIISDEEVISGLSLLPDNIFAILKSPCPKEDDKCVMQTHTLVYITNAINNLTINLPLLGRLAFDKLGLELEKSDLWDENGVEEVAELPGFQWTSDYTLHKMKGFNLTDVFLKSHKWALLTKFSFPNSINPDFNSTLDEALTLNFKSQFDSNPDLQTYKIPSGNTLIACMVYHALKTKEFLFPNLSVAAKEENNLEHFPQIGNFSEIGIQVEDSGKNALDAEVALARIFK